MSKGSLELAERVEAFNQEVISFVENASETDWNKLCAWEEWTVGVVARHIGAGHYGVVALVQMIVDGKKLPELTMDQIVEMANQHAREHANCTKQEVLAVLRENGKALVEFVAGLDETQLARTAEFALFGKEVSAQQFIENVILQSGGEHFAHMKTAASA